MAEAPNIAGHRSSGGDALLAEALQLTSGLVQSAAVLDSAGYPTLANVIRNHAAVSAAALSTENGNG